MVLEGLREVGDPQNVEDPDVILIEAISGYGLTTGNQVFETLWWTGRFFEAARPVEVIRVTRASVKQQLLGKGNTKQPDSVLRTLLIDRYATLAGDPLGGKALAVGLKRSPGPLYGMANDAWAALALACAWMDGAETLDQYRARKAAEAA